MKFLLVVTYLSWQGNLSVKSYPMETMSDCAKGGATISKQVKVGKVNFVCWRNKK